eukprot:scaffold15662_cov109-Isochrysis_galbana.AAC.4
MASPDDAASPSPRSAGLSSRTDMDPEPSRSAATNAARTAAGMSGVPEAAAGGMVPPCRLSSALDVLPSTKDAASAAADAPRSRSDASPSCLPRLSQRAARCRSSACRRFNSRLARERSDARSVEGISGSCSMALSLYCTPRSSCRRREMASRSAARADERRDVCCRRLTIRSRLSAHAVCASATRERFAETVGAGRPGVEPGAAKPVRARGLRACEPCGAIDDPFCGALRLPASAAMPRLAVELPWISSGATLPPRLPRLASIWRCICRCISAQAWLVSISPRRTGAYGSGASPV